MKEKGLVLKKYEMDWDFIISNYLNPELWQKKWVLFQYKEWVITIELSSISCTDEKINFNLEMQDKSSTRQYKYEWGYDNDKSCYNYISYSLKIDDVNFLQRKIKNEIYNLIYKMEQNYIRTLNIYQEIEESSKFEKKELTKIAEQFLDDEGVTNEEIREAYIENYIENNKKIEEKLNDILYENEYNLFTDFYLVYAESTKDDKLIERAKKNTSKVADIESIQKEVEEYMQKLKTEEYKDELKNNLESV